MELQSFRSASQSIRGRSSSSDGESVGFLGMGTSHHHFHDAGMCLSVQNLARHLCISAITTFGAFDNILYDRPDMPGEELLLRFDILLVNSSSVGASISSVES